MSDQVKVSGKVNAANLAEREDIASIVSNQSMSKSAKIRALYAITGDRSTVANLLGIIYQHVRNVLLTPVKGQ